MKISQSQSIDRFMKNNSALQLIYVGSYNRNNKENLFITFWRKNQHRFFANFFISLKFFAINHFHLEIWCCPFLVSANFLLQSPKSLRLKIKIWDKFAKTFFDWLSGTGIEKNAFHRNFEHKRLRNTVLQDWKEGTILANVLTRENYFFFSALKRFSFFFPHSILTSPKPQSNFIVVKKNAKKFFDVFTTAVKPLHDKAI